MNQESLIRKAVGQFSVVKQLFGIEKFLEIARSDPSSPIIYYLSKSLPDLSQIKELLDQLKKDPEHIGVLVKLDFLLRPYHILRHLDNCLSKNKDEKKLNIILDHISNSKSFWQGYCEAEVASNLKDVFGTIELEPELPNGKVADIKFLLNSEDVFAEITVPKKGYRYRNAEEKALKSGKAVRMPDVVERASDKILAELEHFSNILDQVQSIIIINLNESDFEDLDIQDSLMGISKLVLITDRSTGRTNAKVAREDWTAFKMDNELARVGAIICYKRDFHLNGTVVYNKKIFVMCFEKEEYEKLLNLF